MKDIRSYFNTHRDQHILLNADDRNPARVREINADHVVLERVTAEIDPLESVVIPYASIVSIQERADLAGIVVYLMK